LKFDSTILYLLMKRFLLLATLLSVTSIHSADPPTKQRTGGFFNFGSQKSEQISAGLFPERGYAAESSNTIVTSSAGAPASASGSGGSEIFRTGQPKPVDAVSYVIQNGRKVERPIEAAAPLAAPAPAPAPVTQAIESTPNSGVELASGEGRKKGGLFAFGRRGDDAEENEVVTPVPVEGGFAPPRATPPAVSAPAPAPAPIVAAPAAPAVPAAPLTAAPPVTETAETPNFAGVEKEKGDKFGWIPFMGRKKQDAAPVMETAAPAVVATAEPVAPAPTGAAPAPANPATAAPAAPAKPAAATTASTTTPSTTFEVPRDESKKDEKKEVKPGSSGGGILSPIANIRVPRKEIDLTSAETIIQNGEIVAGTETNFETVSTPSTTGQRQAPQVVNGVKTYSSWEDVNARSSSAADKIIGSMR